MWKVLKEEERRWTRRPEQRKAEVVRERWRGKRKKRFEKKCLNPFSGVVIEEIDPVDDWEISRWSCGVFGGGIGALSVCGLAGSSGVCVWVVCFPVVCE